MAGQATLKGELRRSVLHGEGRAALHVGLGCVGHRHVMAADAILRHRRAHIRVERAVAPARSRTLVADRAIKLRDLRDRRAANRHGAAERNTVIHGLQAGPRLFDDPGRQHRGVAISAVAGGLWVWRDRSGWRRSIVRQR